MCIRDRPAASSRLAEEAEEISRENMASEKESAGMGAFAAEKREELADREDSPEEEGLLSRDHTAKFLKEVTGLMGIEAHISRKEEMCIRDRGADAFLKRLDFHGMPVAGQNDLLIQLI